MAGLNSTFPLIPAWTQYSVLFPLWFAIVVFLSVFGSALNYLLFAALVSSRKLRTGSGALIAYAIFLDGVMCAPVLPLLIASTWMGQYGFLSDYLCGWFMLIFCIVVWTSTWAPVPIAFNRFVAVCFPHFYDACVSKNKVALVIIFSLTISISCAVPMYFDVSAKFVATNPWGACGSIVTQASSFALITAMGTTVPTVCQGAAYVSLFLISSARHFFRRREVSAIQRASVVDGRGARSAALQRRRFRTTKMVFATYVWLTLCYMVTPIVLTAAPMAYRNYPMVSLVIRGLLLLGYATSPVRVCNDRASTVKECTRK